MTSLSAERGTLILGGGFGGAYVARLPAKAGAAIVSPESSMLYTSLPEVRRARSSRATLGRYKGIAHVAGLNLRGFPGSFVTRAYHVHQLPLPSRRVRVVADGLIAKAFARDLAELAFEVPAAG
jgi:NADH dehydrogenase FAD-containing subunit